MEIIIRNGKLEEKKEINSHNMALSDQQEKGLEEASERQICARYAYGIEQYLHKRQL